MIDLYEKEEEFEIENVVDDPIIELKVLYNELESCNDDFVKLEILSKIENIQHIIDNKNYN